MRNSDKDAKRVADLLGLLMDDSTDPAAKEQIRAWLWSSVSKEAKDTAIIGLFRQMTPNLVADEFDHKKYAELTARLNINGKTRTARREKKIPLLLRIPPMRTPMRIAASVVLLLGLSGLAYFGLTCIANTEGGDDPTAQVTVSAGPSVRLVQLPDGTSIELGVNSELTYDENFTTDRHVHLDGEALMNVKQATDEAGEFIPFSVITDDLNIDVYGTAFRVIDPADDGDIRSIVTLYDGSVRVVANDAVVTLTPGEEYYFDHVTKKPNVALILAGEMIEHGFKPLLRFEDSTLGNIVTSLSANYGVKFVMPEDIDLSKGKFSGDFHAEDLKSTLNILTKSSAKLSFALNGDRVVVKRK